MNSPTQHGTVPLDYAAELAFEIHLMRAECSDAARQMLEQIPPDEAALDECARLEEALAKAHRVLQGAVAAIRAARSERHA